MKKRNEPFWLLVLRPALAAVFILIYWAHHDPTPDPVPQPPAWVQEDR